MIPAKFRPSWKSPSEVAPSPKVQTRARSFLRIRAARPAPAAWMICEATGMAKGKMLMPGGGARPASLPSLSQGLDQLRKVVPASKTIPNEQYVEWFVAIRAR